MLTCASSVKVILSLINSGMNQVAGTARRMSSRGVVTTKEQLSKWARVVNSSSLSTNRSWQKKYIESFSFGEIKREYMERKNNKMQSQSIYLQCQQSETYFPILKKIGKCYHVIDMSDRGGYFYLGEMNLHVCVYTYMQACTHVQYKEHCFLFLCVRCLVVSDSL